ncbi:mucin-6-like [Callorhinchus milii]|uniref:mucin-6-like n=1 Tax=Callorhinchus milii TaxID=7868 RepID=UPI00045718EC|nr:mucin-6-like [Callorhinchus milii]|eukprot:gi/632984664/ref/XP_007909251.1/ PREDICTED: mucin-6-like [Callorhinchus milii]
MGRSKLAKLKGQQAADTQQAQDLSPFIAYVMDLNMDHDFWMFLFSLIVRLPYCSNGISIKPFGNLIKLVAKQQALDISILWNNHDYLMVELGDKYKNQTCGLCGDFNGSPELNELIWEGLRIDPFHYACLWNLDDPLETCIHKCNNSVQESSPNYVSACALTGFPDLLSLACF